MDQQQLYDWFVESMEGVSNIELAVRTSEGVVNVKVNYTGNIDENDVVINSQDDLDSVENEVGSIVKEFLMGQIKAREDAKVSQTEEARASYNKSIVKFVEAKLTEKGQEWVSDKIAYLIREEGYERDQAAAIAYSMAKKKGYKGTEKE